jgi:hypothetical protein
VTFHITKFKHWKPKQQWRTTGGKQFVDIKTHTRGGKPNQNLVIPRHLALDLQVQMKTIFGYYILTAVNLLSKDT